MKILIFAGTTEGRALAEILWRNEIYAKVCVATDYGSALLSGGIVQVGRLSQSEMEDIIVGEGYSVVVDATHPYATEVSKNIRAACDIVKIEYLRLLRQEGIHGGENEDVFFATSTEEAVKILQGTQGNIFLTTGSKELFKYTQIEDYKMRVYPRVLPMAEVIDECTRLGFSRKQIICMQGPFDYEMNKAMLRWTDCSYLVTKDSGKEGGLQEKLAAAKTVGAKTIVIRRPSLEEGMRFDEVCKYLFAMLSKSQNQRITYSIQGLEDGVSGKIEADEPEKTEASVYEKKDWFPLFVKLQDKNILIVGGGKIALRRVKTLLNFHCNIKVVAREACEEIHTLAEKGSLELCIKPFDEMDLKGVDMVLAITDDKELNIKIAKEGKKRGCLVNVAHEKAYCDFFFPGIAIEGDVIVGVTAQGKNHGLAARAAESIRRELIWLKEK